MSQTADSIPPEVARTLYGLFLERVRRTPHKVAYRACRGADGSWQGVTWQALAREVERWQTALASEGLEPGERVAVMLRNCPEWVMFDQAAMGLGLVTVPLYTDDRPENVAHILADAGARLLLIDRPRTWRKIGAACAAACQLQRVVSLSGEQGATPKEPLRYCEDWLPAIAAVPPPPDAGPEALATIVYTSGTTGRPKGVMLSHRNILRNAASALRRIPVYGNDTFLSFLPLSHTLERTAGYYLPMMAGATVAYARSIPELALDLLSVRPTALIAVPRVFERVNAKLETRLRRRPPIARRLFELAVETGWRRFQHQQGRESWHPSLLAWPLLYRLVARPFLARLGGRLRVAISGGAALSPVIARRFIGLGLPVVQGYGLTETSPVVSGNAIESNDPASIGMPLDEVEVRTDEQGQLLVRGPNVMLGYWNNPNATAAIVDADGWLHTGDQIRIADGRLYITGRLKEIIVLSNGEKVPPADLEMAIALDPFFEQAMVLGEGRPFLSAIVVVNRDLWPDLAGRHGLDPDDPHSLEDSRVKAEGASRIGDLLRHFPVYAKVRRVVLTTEPWTVDAGLITPTMKLKRAELLKHYASRIENIYKGH